MIKKIALLIFVISLFGPFLNQPANSISITGELYEGEASITYRNVTVYAPAVASSESGYVGVISTITVTVQNNGSGRVFVDTLPLTQVDMQGSARLAVKVASALVRNDANSDIDPSKYDYFFVVRTDSPIIGGPSAGGIMTVATISLLQGWELSNKTVMTGMINPDGSIGPIGGIPQNRCSKFSWSNTFLDPGGSRDIYRICSNHRKNKWLGENCNDPSNSQDI
jgi:predicted S18 family serine protease